MWEDLALHFVIIFFSLCRHFPCGISPLLPPFELIKTRRNDLAILMSKIITYPFISSSNNFSRWSCNFGQGLNETQITITGDINWIFLTLLALIFFSSTNNWWKPTTENFNKVKQSTWLCISHVWLNSWTPWPVGKIRKASAAYKCNASKLHRKCPVNKIIIFFPSNWLEHGNGPRLLSVELRHAFPRVSRLPPSLN